MRPPEIIRLSVPRKEPEPEAPAPPALAAEPAAERVLAFVAFFDVRLRQLGDGRSEGGFTETERRALAALGRRRRMLAGELARQLGVDAGYLSRVVGRLVAEGLVERLRGKDRRQSPLAASVAGRAALRRLDREAADVVSELLRPLSPALRGELATAMARVMKILTPPEPAPGRDAAEADEPPPSPLDDVRMRALRGGDLGLVAHRLALLGQEGKRFDAETERRLLTKAAAFLDGFDRARDIGWIAERDNRLAGACLLKGVSEDMAEVSLIHVEPEARGLGLAAMLLEHCLDFAAIAKYRSVTARVAGGETEIADALEAMEFRLVRREQTAAHGGDGLERVWEKRL